MVTQDELQTLMMQDLKVYFDDVFLGTDQLTTAATQTGAVTAGLQDAQLKTGVQQDSTARLNYNRQMFNPRYGKLYMKLRLDNVKNVFAWAGLTTAITEPVWTQTLPMPGWAKHSHTGIMLREGMLYFCTGTGDPDNPMVQTTPIADLDATRWLVYRVAGHRFAWYCLPFTVPYFEEEVIPKLLEGLVRKWSKTYANGSAMPADEPHYIVFYVKNLVSQARTMTVQRVNYAEVYPD